MKPISTKCLAVLNARVLSDKPSLGYGFIDYIARLCFNALILWLLINVPTPMMAQEPDVITIPDGGWHLWPDTNAVWQKDALYLPDEVELNRLPVNPPTGGWGTLNDQNGVAVTLPGTVEQHYWGKFGLHPYTPGEYGYVEKNTNNPNGGLVGDTNVLNGNYEGVSWWWRDVKLPASFANKIVLLHVRGARQRAEIYVNHQLVGYDLIAETSFACDISRALHPGETNQIAIRITNPGGRMEWRDKELLRWGKYSFQKSHGFGGLDRGITLTAHAPIYLEDIWVLNTPQPRTVTAHAVVKNTTGREQCGCLQFCVVDPVTRRISATNALAITVAPNSTSKFEMPLTDEQAELWSLETPRLYEMRGRLCMPDPAVSDEASRSFGFRWFEPRGVGERAELYLNGKRIRLYSAISWGFWGLNGLWPTPELAEKEVRAAKQLGLNMLNFHRNIGKEEVFEQQDRLGLLRYMEPGGGATALRKILPRDTPDLNRAVDTSGNGGDPETFAQRYEDEKILRMIRQFRSHPSLVIYMLQNETDPDLTDARIWNLLRKMNALDPSRVIATKSGIDTFHQVWFAPYTTVPQYADQAGFPGWYDKHTVGGPGVWQDSMYKNPTNFTHWINNPREIVDWGEMLGAAVADNHPLMVQQIKERGGTSYDLMDHEELASAYNRFLDRWHFRKAFPTDRQFYADLGNKCYEFWSLVMETARLCEDNDVLTISGWESTAIENHSGLVDNLRNFKGDPLLIARKLRPLLPVVKPHLLTCAVGDVPKLDLYLINETGWPVEGKLRLGHVGVDGRTNELGEFNLPPYAKDKFVYPVRINFPAPVLTEAGRHTFVVSTEYGTATFNSATVLAVNPKRSDLPPAKVGVVGDLSPIRNDLSGYPQLQVSSFRANEKYDLIIAARKSATNGEALSPQLLEKVSMGTPLLIIAGSSHYADVIAGQLTRLGAFEYQGLIETARDSWMGNWIFVRRHLIYEGLPTDEVMKGDYQIPVSKSFGLMVGCSGLDIVAAYGRDHDRNIGAATFTTKLGRGKIIFQTLTETPPVIRQRLLLNELKYLLPPKQN